MSNRPARITQVEIQRAIRAARKEGAPEVEVKIGGEASIRIPLACDKDESGTTALDAWMAKHADAT
jgi:hypothetical protein